MSGPVIPDAWKNPTEAAEPVAQQQTQSSGTLIRAVKWIGGLVVLLLVIRACSAAIEPTTSASNQSGPSSASAPAAPVAASYGPTEVDKKNWASSMRDEAQTAFSRQQSAQSLVRHFPDSPEGKEAATLLPDLEKALAESLVGQQWSYSSSAEGMSGQSVRTARVESTNTINLDFPYAGPQHGALVLRRHPRWGNDVIFSIEQGQLLCHSYGDCTVQVRFDDGKIIRLEGNPADDNSTEYVFIPAFSRFMKELPRAKTLKIEVSIYQSGNQVFDFDVSGFKPEKFK